MVAPVMQQNPVWTQMFETTLAPSVQPSTNPFGDPMQRSPMQQIVMLMFMFQMLQQVMQMVNTMTGGMNGMGGGMGMGGGGWLDALNGNGQGGGAYSPGMASLFNQDPLGWASTDSAGYQDASPVAATTEGAGLFGDTTGGGQPQDFILQLLMLILSMMGNGPFGDEEEAGGPGESYGPGQGSGGTRGPGDKGGKGGKGGGDTVRSDPTRRPEELPEATGEQVVNETIVVKAGETFDGKGVRFKAGSSLGDGGQGEGQKPVFILEDGAKLKNVQIEGADGVHVYGDAQLDDVWWSDVGEDALTVKSEGDVVINGGGAFNAADKIFQLNAGGSFTVNGFYADTFGKAIRTNGGKEITTDITISNSSFSNAEESIVRTDSSSATITLDNVETDGSEKQTVRTGHSENVFGSVSRLGSSGGSGGGGRTYNPDDGDSFATTQAYGSSAYMPSSSYMPAQNQTSNWSVSSLYESEEEENDDE